MPVARNTLQPNGEKWAAFYCRLSRDDENEGDSNSIAHQKQMLEKYARDHGIKQYRFYVDDGYTGSNFNRPGFKDMMADVDIGQINMIVVKDMSRFGRNYLEVGMYTEMVFPEKDIRFIAIGDGVDSSQGSNDFTAIKNLFNDWFVRDTSKKIRDEVRARGMSGVRIGTQTPYGYIKGENGKLIVDEETAPVVRLIYDLCAQGNGPGQIARILRERHINTPRTMDFLRTGRSDWYDSDSPCGWNSTTVSGILSKKEYLGHTVNFKTTKKSYRSKRTYKNPEDKHVIFENTHEAIIDPELWEVVQKIREQRHRPTLTGKIALFSGIVFCADCGSLLTVRRPSATGEGMRDNYICSKYRNGRGVQKCTTHYIREDVLKNLVLDNLRKVIAYARDYENEFVQQVTDNTMAEQMKYRAASKRQLDKQTRRIGELDAIIQRLYEDMVNGTLTAERFAKMSATYEKEQKDLEDSTAELRKMLEACDQQKVNVKSFLKLVRSYIEPEELTPEILRMFVEKIVIHEADKSSGHRVQRVEIHYNFVGQIDMSAETVKSRRRTTAEIQEQILSNY